MKYRHQLGQLINYKQFLQHVNTLRAESKDIALQVQDLISNTRFWERISYYLKVIEPLVLVLRMVDGDDKNDMGYLYEAMDKAKENLRERNLKTYGKWWAIIDKRWKMTLHHDLHATGYFFNPRFQYKDNVHNDGEVMRGTMNVITRLARTMNERLDAMTEVVPKIDVDELLNEEHPLHVWVETRAEGEIPEFHPDDRLVQACAEDVELEEHVSGYAFVPERGQRPELRRSATVQDTRLSSSQPEFRRSTS
ncbi:hypothetical protein Taro_004463 [Colocasia esculenta]|uniref:Uncharacterized protein n=1 Tax=Colocasia esculenta TaxID=4460 RepID=A0A843TRQ5_COLES|nr:hypothetical protein [Colocasia esculenta]